MSKILGFLLLPDCTISGDVMGKNNCLEIGPSRRARKRSGWDTLDSQPGCTIVARWGYEPLPVKNDHYDLVVASHVLEHIPWFRTRDALAEVYRILSERGEFHVWVPDFGKIVAAYNEGTILEDGWLPLNTERDEWKSLNGRIFWGARKGEIGQEQHFHRACFDATSLKRLLAQAGFQAIESLTRGAGEGHGWIDLGFSCRK